MAELAVLLNQLDQDEAGLTARPSVWSDDLERTIQLDEHYWILAAIKNDPTPECVGRVELFYDKTVVMSCNGAFVNVDSAKKCLNAVVSAYRTCYKVMIS